MMKNNDRRIKNIQQNIEYYKRVYPGCSKLKELQKELRSMKKACK